MMFPWRSNGVWTSLPSERAGTLGDWPRRPASMSRLLGTSSPAGQLESTLRPLAVWPMRLGCSLAISGDGLTTAEEIGGLPPLEQQGLVQKKKSIGCSGAFGMWIPILGSRGRPAPSDPLLYRHEFPIPTPPTTRRPRRRGLAAQAGNRAGRRGRGRECSSAG